MGKQDKMTWIFRRRDSGARFFCAIDAIAINVATVPTVSTSANGKGRPGVKK